MGLGKAFVVALATFFLFFIPCLILAMPLMPVVNEMGLLEKTGVAVSIVGTCYFLGYPLFVYLIDVASELSKDVGE